MAADLPGQASQHGSPISSRVRKPFFIPKLTDLRNWKGALGLGAGLLSVARRAANPFQSAGCWPSRGSSPAMATSQKKKKSKKKKGSYTVPPNVMKLITLVTLLVSDADVLFTFTSFYAYLTNTKADPTPEDPDNKSPDPLYIMVIVVSLFTFVYIGGCVVAARESRLFVFRFREKVRLNEIAGLDVEEMDSFFSGKPVRKAEPKSLEQNEKAFKDKAKGKSTGGSRAAKDGHITLSRSETGLSGGRNVHGGGGTEAVDEDDDGESHYVRLAPTPQEAVKKYNEDKERALFLLCQAKDITFAFFRERRDFARRVVKPSHSIPLMRLMWYGWQPTVSHTDFAGILNANALYSFTIGFPQLGCSIIYIVNYNMDAILLLSLGMPRI